MLRVDPLELQEIGVAVFAPSGPVNVAAKLIFSPPEGAIATFASMFRMTTSPLNGNGLPSSPVTVTETADAAAGAAAAAVSATASAVRACLNDIKSASLLRGLRAPGPASRRR